MCVIVASCWMFVVKWLVAASFMGLHPLLSHSAVVEQPHMRSAGLTPVVAHGACVAQGVLACKMLGWEDPLAAQLRVLRDKEAKHLATHSGHQHGAAGKALVLLGGWVNVKRGMRVQQLISEWSGWNC